MKHILQPLLLVLVLTVLSSHRPATSVSQLVTEWQRAREYTKEYLDAMPEDGIAYKPTPEIRSFGEQMLHLASGNYLFGSTATGKTNPMAGKSMEKMEELKTKAALTKAVLDSYDFVIDGLKGMSDAQLAESIKFGKNELSRELAFAKGFEHQTHHRGQATIYIRMKGIKPPNEKLF
ncbi:DinB family protein [Spirosoma sordidisoli]|uniref:DinB family protein n=1 Tax=Spirosoma sordidisoli TaxID=2502893 RepID=A0A4Q2UG31_9BACT|nr:DinB family protein [Spirosoma sordidisoli]RYC67392.1 DinB family protein [Spirosoma sordidisoli]